MTEMTTIALPVSYIVSVVVTALLLFCGFVFAVWKIVNRVQTKQAEAAMTCACEAAKKAEENEKDLLRLRAELPVDYVRREDFIRNQTIIEAKLDAMAAALKQGGSSGC